MWVYNDVVYSSDPDLVSSDELDDRWQTQKQQEFFLNLAKNLCGITFSKTLVQPINFWSISELEV